MAMSALVNQHREPERAQPYRSAIGGWAVVISFATVMELRYGAIKAGWGDLRRRGLERDLKMITIVSSSDDVVTTCAVLRSECETHGHALGQKHHEADRWIAATAIRLGLDLVSADGVYQDTPRLRVVVPGF
jgi:tRNA(fMet)-specific endonuclease VapC